MPALSRPLGFSRDLAAALALAAAVISATAISAAPVSTQGRLEAQYVMTLAGLPIGKGTWIIDVSEGQYSAEAKGGTTGLLRVFAGGDGKTTAHGTLQAGHPVLSSYVASINTSKKSDETRLTVINGKVKDLALDPPVDIDPERVPVTPEVERGVIDPMTATLVRMPGTGNPLTPEACQRSLAVFDGRMRYDLQFAFKRMDKVKAEKGYEGPVVVCAVYFSPVAGHIPSRAAIKYLSKQRDMEVWLAPIAGTRILVPFRAQGPTPIGIAVLQATEFVAAPAKDAPKPVAKPPEKKPEKKASATDAKSQ